MQRYFVYEGERMIAVVHAQSEQYAIAIARRKTARTAVVTANFTTAQPYWHRRRSSHPARFLLRLITSFGP